MKLRWNKVWFLLMLECETDAEREALTNLKCKLAEINENRNFDSNVIQINGNSIIIDAEARKISLKPTEC